MPRFIPPAIAVIADAHLHDIGGDYGVSGVLVDGKLLALRPFADTVKSTRVFNESGRALRHALDDIRARGIRHVVLLGDYSDDGQMTSLMGLRRLLDDYTRRFGIRFFATPGNHDIFGAVGRHRSRRFLNRGGGHDLATSDPHRSARFGEDAVIVSDRMRCPGYPQGLQMLPDLGFFRRPGDLHWETPFGQQDDAAERIYTAHSPDGMTSRSLMDGSYLVEPIDGLWMAMIDANVFVPLDGNADFGEEAFEDSTNAGWNAMLAQKRFILDWLRDLSMRAKKLGKTLIAFSHYPALDPLNGTLDDERALLGETSILRRIPDRSVGEALIEAGIRVHFSGHLHVNDTARQTNADGFLVNVSVPSLVAFPAAYKIFSVKPGQLTVDTIGIGDMALDTGIMDTYRIEAERTRITARGMLGARTYGIFLSEHLGHLIGRRYLRREWPHDLAQAAETLDLLDLALLSLCQTSVSWTDLPAALGIARSNPNSVERLKIRAQSVGVDWRLLAQIRMMAFLGDWYRVRMGSDLGLDAIAPYRLSVYRLVSRLYAGRAVDEGSVQAHFCRLFSMFDRFISGLPSRDFVIDLTTGDIQAKSNSRFS